MSSLFRTKKMTTDQEGPSNEETSSPVPVDVYQQDSKLIVLAPIAGVAIEDISLTITDDLLTISGERKKDEDFRDADYFSQECFWGPFHRSIVLPVAVDTEHVAAFYKKGILRIEMEIIEEEKVKIIPITLHE